MFHSVEGVKYSDRACCEIGSNISSEMCSIPDEKSDTDTTAVYIVIIVSWSLFVFFLCCWVRQSLREVQEACVYLKGVERRWGVVILDQSDDEGVDDLEEFEESGGELVGRTSHDHRGCVSGQQLQQQQQADGRDEQHQATTIATAAQSIEITSSGESLVNGIYHHSTTSNSSSTITSSNSAITSSTGSNVYIHSSGPFHIRIHQQNYDVCLFPKVYGDKFRWCVGLVPCSAACHGVAVGSRSRSSDRRSNTNEDEQHSEQQQQQQENDNYRTRDFDLAFIYYWTNDIPIPTTSSSPTNTNQEEQGGSVIPSLSVIQQWGACHGERPLPIISVWNYRVSP